MNALYDLNPHTYMDAVIQPVHFKDEFKAFCTMAGHLPVLKEGADGLCLDIVIKRSHSRKITASGDYVTFVNAASAFDFIPYGSLNTYTIPVQAVRFPLDDGSYECIMTSLPADGFTTEDIKRLYFPDGELKHLSASPSTLLAWAVSIPISRNL